MFGIDMTVERMKDVEEQAMNNISLHFNFI